MLTFATLLLSICASNPDCVTPVLECVDAKVMERDYQNFTRAVVNSLIKECVEEYETDPIGISSNEVD
jgi:hypothetical protein